MKFRPNSRIAEARPYGSNIRETQVPHPVAQFAMQLIERWAMVAAFPDGEDSAGRAKVRLSTPEEIVSRACQTAQMAFEQFGLKDWLLDVPQPTEEELKKLESGNGLGKYLKS